MANNVSVPKEFHEKGVMDVIVSTHLSTLHLPGLLTLGPCRRKLSCTNGSEGVRSS